MLVDTIYIIIHLFLSLSKGCLIGSHGSIHRKLESETGCRIIVINKEGVSHACEVTSNSQSTTENGARFLIDHMIRELNLENDEATKQGFRFQLKNKDAFAWRIYLPLPKQAFLGTR
jgi:RecA-family ATPase